MTQTSKFSTPSLLINLEEVAKTRTPIWDEWSGDIRIKLDTDVNGQEWYVIQDNSNRGGTFTGEVPCLAFPHWCGSHDMYSYVPVPFCFKTFASLLEEYPQHTKHAKWHYDKEEYRQRLEHAISQNEQTGSLEVNQSTNTGARKQCERIFDWLNEIGAISGQSKQHYLEKVDEFFAQRADDWEGVADHPF